MAPLLFATLLAGAPARAQSEALAAQSRDAKQAMSDGRFDAAAALYRELVKALPDEAGLHMNLGMALAMGGHEADAVAPLERAVRLQPALLPAQLFLGSTYLSLGRPDAAVGPLRAVVAGRPNDPHAWYDWRGPTTRSSRSRSRASTARRRNRRGATCSSATRCATTDGCRRLSRSIAARSIS